MRKRKGSTALENHNKGTNISLIYKVLEIFKTGQGVTAYGLNRAVGFNDARKTISLLRGKGYPIKDRRLTDHRKVYFLPHDWEKTTIAKQDIRQLMLFEL
jgi:hypothetical protein